MNLGNPPGREVHIWWALIGPPAEPRGIESCLAILDDGERRRALRFRPESARLQFIVGHALTRIALSRYVAVAPADWRFDTAPDGKPFVGQPVQGRHLRFNLSHAEGIVACGIANGLDLGVDVENLERSGEITDLARRFFAPEEAERLLSSPGHQLQPLFYDIWTLKEAYVKATGAGLSAPLRDFWFPGAALAGEIEIRFRAGIEQDPGDWRFFRFRPGGRHTVAVGVRDPQRQSLLFRDREMILTATGLEPVATAA